MKCSRCKTTDNLLKYATNAQGRVYYMCRECNAKRAAEYRNTEHGRERIYAAIKKFRAKNKSTGVNASV